MWDEVPLLLWTCACVVPARGFFQKSVSMQKTPKTKPSKGYKNDANMCRLLFRFKMEAKSNLWASALI